LNARDNSGQVLKYASGYHAPVLCKAVIQGLVTRENGIYVDGTLGGGGHTAAMLEVLGAKGRVIAIDRDEDAIAEASARLSSDIEKGRLTILKGNFSDVRRLLDEADIAQVDGFFLDLGVSSHQLDVAERGFSHRMSGPLDMRMDQSQGQRAEELINSMEFADLARILRRFGEEPRAGRIAKSIIASRPIDSTEQLAESVRSSVPHMQESKSLSRVFQALRIAVNDELEELDRVLLDSRLILNEGGRLAVIAYHSLEDRQVKRFMRSGNFEGKVHRDVYGNRLTPWNEITRKPLTADEEEIEANPRSRSARLRIAERIKDIETSLKAD